MNKHVHKVAAEMTMGQLHQARLKIT